MRPIEAVEDPSFAAQIASRRQLYYRNVHRNVRAGYPSYVRAGSSLSWFLDKLAVVQDDTLLLGLIDVATGSVDAIDLPLREDGARTFDSERGNKAHKADLEASFSADWHGAPALFALGSGSHENRESFAIIESTPEMQSRFVHAPAFYASLRSHAEFLTTELNLEGAVLLQRQILRLFQRSNGSLAQGQAHALCATCDVAWPELVAYLEAPERRAPPRIGNVQHYDLGRIGASRLTFTDATLWSDGTLLYSASAESSPNAFDDGVVSGSALGVLRDGSARYCLLRDERGSVAQDKVEGIARAGDANHAYLVFDPDDHQRPASLAEVRLSGF